MASLRLRLRHTLLSTAVLLSAIVVLSQCRIASAQDDTLPGCMVNQQDVVFVLDLNAPTRELGISTNMSLAVSQLISLLDVHEQQARVAVFIADNEVVQFHQLSDPQDASIISAGVIQYSAMFGAESTLPQATEAAMQHALAHARVGYESNVVVVTSSVAAPLAVQNTTAFKQAGGILSAIVYGTDGAPFGDTVRTSWLNALSQPGSRFLLTRHNVLGTAQSAIHHILCSIDIVSVTLDLVAGQVTLAVSRIVPLGAWNTSALVFSTTDHPLVSTPAMYRLRGSLAILPRLTESGSREVNLVLPSHDVKALEQQRDLAQSTLSTQLVVDGAFVDPLRWLPQQNGTLYPLKSLVAQLPSYGLRDLVPVSVQPRAVAFTWDVPLISNGPIQAYNIYCLGQFEAPTSAPTLGYLDLFGPPPTVNVDLAPATSFDLLASGTISPSKESVEYVTLTSNNFYTQSMFAPLSDSFTIALDLVQQPGNVGVIFEKSDGQGTVFYRLLSNGATGQLYFYYRALGASSLSAARFNVNLAQQRLFSLLLTVAKAQVTLRVNSQIISIQPLQPPFLGIQDCAVQGSPNCQLTIGASTGTSPSSTYFVGTILQARVFPTVAMSSQPLPSTTAEPSTSVAPTTRVEDGGDYVLVVHTTTPSTRLVSNLKPAQKYQCALQVVNVFGARTSAPLLFTTASDSPQGLVPPQVTSITATSAQLTLQPAEFPNGFSLSYHLTVTFASFLSPNATQVSPYTVHDATYTSLVTIPLSSLRPYSEYTISLVVANEAGSTTARTTTLYTKEAAPQGVVAPSVVGTTPFSAALHPMSVLFPNGPFVELNLFLAPFPAENLTEQAVQIATVDTLASLTVSELEPYTFYQVGAQAYNGHSRSNIVWSIPFRTAESTPSTVNNLAVNASSTAISISFSLPAKPNGVLILYKATLVAADSPSSTIATTERAADPVHDGVGKLLTLGFEAVNASTLYTVSVVACTNAGCGTSAITQITTADAPPSGLLDLQVEPLNATSAQIQWQPPRAANGQLIKYTLTVTPQIGCEAAVYSTCDLVACGQHEELCGSICFDPSKTTCCNGVVYATKEGFECCDANYLDPFGLLDDDAQCCGGYFVSMQDDYQCCGGASVPVPPGHVCCDGHVSQGDSCCGMHGYFDDVDAPPLCCDGNLFDFTTTRQCCGETVISTQATCCNGVSHAVKDGACCGSELVGPNQTCCSSGLASQVVEGSQVQCCGSKPLIEGQVCASTTFVGETPLLSSTCAVPSQQCAEAEASAGVLGCGSCEPHASTDVCHVISPTAKAFSVHDPQQACGQDAATNAAISLELSPTTTSIHLTQLEPAVNYTVLLHVVGSGGPTAFPVASFKTTAADAQGVRPPTVHTIAPMQVTLVVPPALYPNGIVQYFVRIVHDLDSRVVRVQPLEVVVVSALKPSTTYAMSTVVCSIDTPCVGLEDNSDPGVSVSSPIQVTTLQQAPVEAAVAAILAGPRSLALQFNVTYNVEKNGAITHHLVKTNASTTGTVKTKQSAIALSQLRPYTVYELTVASCNLAGCAWGAAHTVMTLQAAPEAPLVAPTLVEHGPREVFLSWSAPTTPNGVISHYTVMRSGQALNTTVTRNFVDTQARPFTRYDYAYVAHTAGGNTTSEAAVVHTAPALAEGLAVPDIVFATSTSVKLSWSFPEHVNDAVGYFQLFRVTNTSTVYQVDNATLVYNGTALEYTDINLAPFTEYSYVLGVVNSVGLAVPAHSLPALGLVSRSVSTAEALPSQPQPPSVIVNSLTDVTVSWLPPLIPNGVVTRYTLQRRIVLIPPVQPVTVTIAAVPGQIQDADALQPYQVYEYRVLVANIKGEVASTWTTATSCSSFPDRVTNAQQVSADVDRVSVAWSAPSVLAGPADKATYRVHVEGTEGDVRVTDTKVELGSLATASTYNVSVRTCVPDTCIVSGSGGVASAEWCGEPVTVSISTMGQPPLGLLPPSAIIVGSTRAFVSWTAPLETYGSEVSYSLWRNGSSGALVTNTTATHFEDVNLIPNTTYVYMLEARTQWGAIQSVSNPITPLETKSSGLDAPVVTAVSTGVSASVRACWSPPRVLASPVISFTVIIADTGVGVSASAIARCATVLDLPGNTVLQVLVKACTSVDCIVSPPTEVDTPCLLPTAVTPVVETRTATSATLVWPAPAQPNCDMVMYSLVLDGVVRYTGTARRATVQPLSPSTVYTAAVQAATSAGSTTGATVVVQTLAMPPIGFDLVTVSVLSSSTALVSWNVPTKPNVEDVSTLTYQVFLDGVKVATTDGAKFFYQAKDLAPFTTYRFAAAACNSAGCTRTAAVSAQTRVGVPSQVVQPIVSDVASNSLAITWQTPFVSTGPLTAAVLYLERCIDLGVDCFSSAAHATIADNTTLDIASGDFFVVVSSSFVIPYSFYRLRLGLSTTAGEGLSDWVSSYAKPCDCPDPELVPLQTLPSAPIVAPGSSVACTVESETLSEPSLLCNWAGAFVLYSPTVAYRVTVNAFGIDTIIAATNINLVVTSFGNVQVTVRAVSDFGDVALSTTVVVPAPPATTMVTTSSSMTASTVGPTVAAVAGLSGRTAGGIAGTILLLIVVVALIVLFRRRESMEDGVTLGSSTTGHTANASFLSAVSVSSDKQPHFWDTSIRTVEFAPSQSFQQSRLSGGAASRGVLEEDAWSLDGLSAAIHDIHESWNESMAAEADTTETALDEVPVMQSSTLVDTTMGPLPSYSAAGTTLSAYRRSYTHNVSHIEPSVPLVPPSPLPEPSFRAVANASGTYGYDSLEEPPVAVEDAVSEPALANDSEEDSDDDGAYVTPLRSIRSLYDGHALERRDSLDIRMSMFEESDELTEFRANLPVMPPLAEGVEEDECGDRVVDSSSSSDSGSDSEDTEVAGVNATLGSIDDQGPPLLHFPPPPPPESDGEDSSDRRSSSSGEDEDTDASVDQSTSALNEPRSTEAPLAMTMPNVVSTHDGSRSDSSDSESSSSDSDSETEPEAAAKTDIEVDELSIEYVQEEPVNATQTVPSEPELGAVADNNASEPSSESGSGSGSESESNSSRAQSPIVEQVRSPSPETSVAAVKSEPDVELRARRNSVLKRLSSRGSFSSDAAVVPSEATWKTPTKSWLSQEAAAKIRHNMQQATSVDDASYFAVALLRTLQSEASSSAISDFMTRRSSGVRSRSSSMVQVDDGLSDASASAAAATGTEQPSARASFALAPPTTAPPTSPPTVSTAVSSLDMDDSQQLSMGDGVDSDDGEC
eukprot:m.132318 g.132318  ORF g.132318 m.132318 type:complete len:3245 (-) comp13933_c0_seq1:3387-13121(-)